MNTIKSDFQEILPEDCKQFNDVAQAYLDLHPENYSDAYILMQQSWSIAQRWSEIQASSRKIANLRPEVQKTDFSTWAYQRYRQMQEIHVSCRVIWRMGEDQAKYFERNERKKVEQHKQQPTN